MVFVGLYQRISRSYDVALEMYEERVAAGVQPSTRVVDLFNVGTQEALLLSANFLYLGLVILLYLRMMVSVRDAHLYFSKSISTTALLLLYTRYIRMQSTNSSSRVLDAYGRAAAAVYESCWHIQLLQQYELVRV